MGGQKLSPSGHAARDRAHVRRGAQQRDIGEFRAQRRLRVRFPNSWRIRQRDGVRTIKRKPHNFPVSLVTIFHPKVRDRRVQQADHVLFEPRAAVERQRDRGCQRGRPQGAPREEVHHESEGGRERAMSVESGVQ